MAEKSLHDLQREHATVPPRSRFRAGERREASAVRNYVRDLILGFNDGLVSVYAVVAGVVGATFTTSQVAISGLAAALAGALSMGLGEYLSTKSQTEFYEHERTLERRHIAEHGDLEQEELTEFLTRKGVAPQLARQIVDDAAKDPDRFLDLMMREEFGLGVETERSPFVAMGLVMAAFVVGAALPVVPFLVGTPTSTAFLAATALSLAGLFAAGATRSIASGLSWWKGGSEMAILGGVAAAITYGVGTLVGVTV